MLCTRRSKFCLFGNILGNSINKFNKVGNQGWVAHIGTMSITFLTLSSSTFCSTLLIIVKGGKLYGLNSDQEILKASEVIASGSGNQDTYFVICLLSLEANKSISG